MAIKNILAIVIASGLLVAAAGYRRRRRTLAASLLLGASSCFLVVAIVHLFEAFSLMQSAGWGQPHSVGHYIDLSAAILATTLFVAACGVASVRRGGR